jgi:hypothetical protein
VKTITKLFEAMLTKDSAPTWGAQQGATGLHGWNPRAEGGPTGLHGWNPR